MSFILAQSSQHVQFQWYRHPEFDMAMGVTLDPEDFTIGDYCLKLHPLDPGNPDAFGSGEYFCDPDSIIAVATPGSKKFSQIAYLPYLRWKRNITVSDKSVVVSFRHRPRDGHHAILPSLNLPLTIVESHRMDVDTELVISDVSITNHYNDHLDILYCYQDAAYLWFPCADQRLVETWVEIDGRAIYKRYISAKGCGFCHTSLVDRTHGVIAGIGMDTPGGMVAATPYYVGFHGHINLALGKLVGLAYFGGKAVRPAHVLNDVSSWGGLPNTSHSLKNRAVLFPLKSVRPGECRSMRFYRMGRYLQRPLNDNDLVIYSKDFMEIVTRLKDREQLNSSSL